MKAFDAPPEVIAAAREQLHAKQGQQRLAIWPCHWRAVQVFLAMQTQWRVCAGMRGREYTGLDYAALPIVLARMRWHDAAPDPGECELFTQLRTLESAALQALREN